MSTNDEKSNRLASLLMRRGMGETWAKLLAGAVVGALAAAGMLTGGLF